VEVQGTAEHAAFSREELAQLTDLALHGTAELARLQLSAVSGAAG
jgi:ribonuclease PH